MNYNIPIDFCPLCGNKKIRVVQGKTFEAEYSLSGKCLKRTSIRFADTCYTLLVCRKCGWQSSSWGESFCDDREWEKLQKIYENNTQSKN